MAIYVQKSDLYRLPIYKIYACCTFNIQELAYKKVLVDHIFSSQFMSLVLRHQSLVPLHSMSVLFRFISYNYLLPNF